MTSASQRDLRAAGLRARRNLGADERRVASRRITETFLRSPYFLKARTIACYISMPEEVDTSGIIARAWAASKRIFCPVVAGGRRLRFVEVSRESALERSDFGLLEPVDGDTIEPLALDIVVTPVVAFDTVGHRIGMGGGYYDRTFRALGNRRSWLHPKLVGIAFGCQKVRKIKANPWDIRLCEILTEND